MAKKIGIVLSHRNLKAQQFAISVLHKLLGDFIVIHDMIIDGNFEATGTRYRVSACFTGNHNVLSIGFFMAQSSDELLGPVTFGRSERVHRKHNVDRLSITFKNFNLFVTAAMQEAARALVHLEE